MSSPAPNPAEGEVERREFLKRGVLATAAAAAAGVPSQRASADEPQPDALAGIKKLLAGMAALTWVFTGDSITHGALHTLGWRSYPEHFAERVRWELHRMRDVVINTGISGENAGGLLADIEWRVLRFDPAVVSIMIGMNDAAGGASGRDPFRQNLTSLVEKVRENGAIPLLNTPNTIYEKNVDNRADLPAFAQIVREVAATTHCGLVDHWAHWQQAKPNQEDLLPWLEDQRLHPGVYGHREFAKLIFRDLGIFDETSPTCLLEVP
jgi:lysophospholipase L1-like esterase